MSSGWRDRRRRGWSGGRGAVDDDWLAHTPYLGNRPHPKGVVEKCHFCIQRARNDIPPACHAACPTGARVFGNLLDPDSEIRYVFENKAVFRLKEELGTEPKLWYFRDT